MCLLRSGARDEGLPLVERSVGLAPRNLLYRQNFGLMLAEAGELAAAEQSFRDIIALDEENPTAHNYLGMVQQRLGRFDQAIACYEEALRLRPADAAAANNLGYRLLERGDVEGATPWLRRSIAADPGNALAHSNLGNALRTSGDLQGAAECYRRASRLAPGFVNAHHNLALTLRDLGDPLRRPRIRPPGRAPGSAAPCGMAALRRGPGAEPLYGLERGLRRRLRTPLLPGGGRCSALRPGDSQPGPEGPRGRLFLCCSSTR